MPVDTRLGHLSVSAQRRRVKIHRRLMTCYRPQEEYLAGTDPSAEHTELDSSGLMGYDVT